MNNNIEGESNNDGEFFSEKDVNLTACKTSLFFVNDGFNVYNCHGQLVFRVDSYRSEGGDQGEIVLMDASGRCLLTVRRKRPSLHNRWDGYIGERTEESKPIFSVKRSSILGRSEVNVEVYDNEGEEYQIDGCFEDRSCTIYDATTREVMAEIRRKVDISSKVVMGKDAFSILIKPGFDSAFAMGLVLVLDQINADGDDDVSDELSVPTDGLPHVLDDVSGGLSTVAADGLPDGLPDVSGGLSSVASDGFAHVLDDVSGGLSSVPTDGLPHVLDDVSGGLSTVADDGLPDGLDDVSGGLSSVASDGFADGLSDWLNGLDDISNNKLNVALATSAVM